MSKTDPTTGSKTVVEVAPECVHVNATEQMNDPETRKVMIRRYCPKCGWDSGWIEQSKAILTPIGPAGTPLIIPPVVQQF